MTTEWTRAEDCPAEYEQDGRAFAQVPFEGNPDADPEPALLLGDPDGTALAVEGTAADLRAFVGRVASALPSSVGMTEEEHDELYESLSGLLEHAGWPTSEATYDLLHALVDSMGDRRKQDDDDDEEDRGTEGVALS